MSPDEAMRRIDLLLDHVWMVRTFLKHSEEAEEDDELRDVHRGLYDFMLAVGGPVKDDDPAAFMKMCRKKLSRLKKTNDLFQEIQPEISSHTNFEKAARSLATSIAEIEDILEQV